MTHLAESNIVKIDEDQQLVFGWASVIADESGQTILDRQADFIDSPDELEKSAYDYVLHCRDGGEMHVRKGVATMVESMVFTQEKQDALGVPRGTMPVGWWLGFKVNDADVWAEVKKQEYMGFSVHGKGRREKVDIDINEFNHDQPVRKMHGAEWPAEAFAYVPDPAKPSTWRIRTWETVEKGATPRSVSRAIAAWSRSELDHSVVAKSGLSKAWHQVHPGTPPPKEIQTVTDYDRKRILLKARTAMAISKHARHDQKTHGNWAGGGLRRTGKPEDWTISPGMDGEPGHYRRNGKEVNSDLSLRRLLDEAPVGSRIRVLDGDDLKTVSEHTVGKPGGSKGGGGSKAAHLKNPKLKAAYESYVRSADGGALSMSDWYPTTGGEAARRKLGLEAPPVPRAGKKRDGSDSVRSAWEGTQEELYDD